MMSSSRTETSINEATSKGVQLETFQSEKVTLAFHKCYVIWPTRNLLHDVLAYT